MGVVLMSKRELNRIDVLARLDGGRLTTSAAADLMRLTTRQIFTVQKALPLSGQGLRSSSRLRSPASRVKSSETIQACGQAR